MNFLFDLYGTLIDIHTDESGDDFWREIANWLGDDDFAHVRAEYKKLCQEESLGDMQEFDLLRVFQRMLCERGLNEGDASKFATFFRETSTKKLRLFPHVKDILSGLRVRGAGVYLLSNAQSCFTRHELDLLSLTPLFDGIIISSEIGCKKPSKKIFELALEQFGIMRDESIYVGNDLRDDVCGAHSAGIKAVYIPTEQSGVYPSINELPEFETKSHLELSSLLFSIAEDNVAL